MAYIWTGEEIEKILIQLDGQCYPFKKYTFTREEENLILLEKGGYAYVYQAKKRDKSKELFAIKVIGFSDKHVDSEAFREAVHVQEKIGQLQNHVVKLFDAVELRVWIEEDNSVTKVEEINAGNNSSSEGNYLDLQFIIMEELIPVVKANQSTKPILMPEALTDFDEKEILKLAYDIGQALSDAHQKSLLHRDVKLENIFYSSKEKCYKLGDFGIAKVSDDGMASTVVFTKGYAAPEVIGRLEDKYDQTADIYSLGMLLYVLLNGLRFPESKNYSVNIKTQYQQGYMAPWPLYGSDQFCKIVEKMCRFNPDDRYQSMEAVLNDLDQLIHGRSVKYSREHKGASLLVGTLLAFLGTALWKLSFWPDMQIDLTIGMYLFLALCIGKGLLKVLKKDVALISVLLLGVGIYLAFATGFIWWKLVIVLLLSFMLDISAGIFGGSVLVADGVCSLIQQNPEILQYFQDTKWVAVTIFSMALVLLLQYSVLNQRDQKITSMYYKRNIYWMLVIGHYGCLFLLDAMLHMFSANEHNVIYEFLGKRTIDILLACKLNRIGIAGIIFCLIWIGREMILVRLTKNKNT